MSHLVIVGGSTGIGRDIVPHISADVTHLPRGASLDVVGRPFTGLLLCQRYRGPDEWAGDMAVSLTRTNELCEWVGARMSDVSIVVMASVAAVSVEEEQPVSYHACKAALIEMVKYYAVTLGPKQIRVNAIIPGLTIKPEARAFYDAHPELEATYKDITPLGRMGTVKDIAQLVNFLIGEQSPHLTGQTIALDGGISLRSAWAIARRVNPELRGLPVTQRARK